MKLQLIKPPYHLVPLITNGLTNDLFLLNKTYFLKKSKSLPQPFLNITNQQRVVNIINDRKFTLPIIETTIDNNKLLTVMVYYPHLITLNEQAITAPILKKMATLVQSLHTINYDETFAITTWNGLQQLQLYRNLITTKVNLNAINEKITTWITNYQPAKLVLCHNDLTINNFVNTNKQWYLIDWDFACWNDPLFDIASFASETLTNDDDIKLWWTNFKLSPAEITICYQWMTYQNFIWYYWACYLYEQTKQPIYQTISNEKLAKLLDANK